MTISVVKMAQNGQVVIPMNVRKQAGLRPSESFIVYYDGAQILLRPVDENLPKDLELIEKIRRAEIEIRAGKAVTVGAHKTAKEIDKILMK